MSFKITLENIFGTLDSSVVAFREDIQPAVLKMLQRTPYMSPGDRIQVEAVDMFTGKPCRR